VIDAIGLVWPVTTAIGTSTSGIGVGDGEGVGDGLAVGVGSALDESLGAGVSLRQAPRTKATANDRSAMGARRGDIGTEW
jgi:hypothetical protein